MTTALICAPSNKSPGRLWPCMLSRTYGNCRPIRANTIPFKMKVRACQTAQACNRTPGEKKCALRRLNSNPHTTTERTPEACARSADK